MRIHEAAFWGIIFFLVGVFLAPSIKMIGIGILTIGMMGGGAVYAYKIKNKQIKHGALLVGLMLIGALYWSGYNVQQKNKTIAFIGNHITAAGHVIDVRKSEKVQQVRIAIDGPKGGIVAVTARAYPQVAYGDAVWVKGVVKRPDTISAQYLMKDAIFASMDFPTIEIRKHGDGNPTKQYLFGLRRSIVATYERALVPNEAALLAGVTLGERANFDKEFVLQMKQSGTTHLVALSGYNISIIAITIVSLLSRVIKGGSKFWVAFMMIALFVIMAGAEASAVRAAIMGSIALLAQYIGRAHSMRNAIAISALLMVMWNPNVLRYDLGFQLSFMALIGIVYVKPYMDIVIKRGNEGILEWRENLSGTMAAQLAVFPILMHQIGSFSITALLSNLLVLAFIPVTMGLGFIMGVVGFISPWLVSICAPLASVLLRYEIEVIRVFGSHAGLTMGMSMGAVVLYYGVGLGAMAYLRKKNISV